MNTPFPCSRCKNLYYDVMTQDDPNQECECMLDQKMGDNDCMYFEEYSGD